MSGNCKVLQISYSYDLFLAVRPVGSAAVTSVDMPVEGGFGRVGGAEMEALGNFL